MIIVLIDLFDSFLIEGALPFAAPPFHPNIKYNLIKTIKKTILMVSAGSIIEQTLSWSSIFIEHPSWVLYFWIINPEGLFPVRFYSIFLIILSLCIYFGALRVRLFVFAGGRPVGEKFSIFRTTLQIEGVLISLRCVRRRVCGSFCAYVRNGLQIGKDLLLFVFFGDK